jgi:hypothetical protein
VMPRLESEIRTGADVRRHPRVSATALIAGGASEASLEDANMQELVTILRGPRKSAGTSSG